MFSIPFCLQVFHVSCVCLILIQTQKPSAKFYLFEIFLGYEFPARYTQTGKTVQNGPWEQQTEKSLSACVIDYCLSALPVVLRTFCLFVAGIYPINSYPRGETEISAPSEWFHCRDK